MGLSCACDFDGSDFDWYWTTDGKFHMLTTSRRKRCKSCGDLIELGSDVILIERYRGPNTEMEEKILGEDAEIPLANWHFCEECGGLYLALNELEYCISMPTEGLCNMRELVKQHNLMRGE